MTAENLHRRLKDDLFSAMKDRDRDRVDALRLAVAALDNAGAVQFEARSSLLPPLTGLSTDVERKQLAEGEGIALLQTEVEHLLESAESNAAAGRDHEAGRHRRMADILEAYLRP